MIVTGIVLLIVIIVSITMIIGNSEPLSSTENHSNNKLSLFAVVIIIFILFITCGFIFYVQDCKKFLEKQQKEYCQEINMQLNEKLKEEAINRTIEEAVKDFNLSYEEQEEKRIAREKQQEIELKDAMEEYKQQQEKNKDGVLVPFSIESSQQNIYQQLDALCSIPISNEEALKYALKRLTGSK